MVVVTTQVVLARNPTVVHVVPLIATRRDFRSEIDLDPDDSNGLSQPFAAQCQHLRTVATDRLTEALGNVGPTALRQIRETVADLLDL